MYSRRALSGYGLAAAAGFAVSRADLGNTLAFGSTCVPSGNPVPVIAGGICLGTCHYNYRDIPRSLDAIEYLDMISLAAAQAGGGLIELNSTWIEPPTDLPQSGLPRDHDTRPPGSWSTKPIEELQRQREALRRWRLSLPTNFYSQIRQKFEARGLRPFALSFVFTTDIADAEIDYAFQAARALGASVIATNSTKVEMGPRLVSYAERHNLKLGWHNHAAPEDPNEVSSYESYDTLLKMSPRYFANLDLGWMTSADLDPIAFIKKHAQRISHIHMKDRRRDMGPGTPWGEGDAPLREALLLIKEHQYRIPCLVEYEYRGTLSSIDETKKCMKFMQDILV